MVGFDQLNADRAAVIGWRAAAQAAHDEANEAAATVATMEIAWLNHLAAGGDPGLETARAMFPGRWFELWRACR